MIMSFGAAFLVFVADLVEGGAFATRHLCGDKRGFAA